MCPNANYKVRFSPEFHSLQHAVLLTAHNFTPYLVSNAKNWGEVCSQIVSVV